MKNESFSSKEVLLRHVSLRFKKRLKPRNTLFLLIAVFSSSSCVTKDENLLFISEQRSFTVGGTVITIPGTFNPYNQTLAGQTYHGDHAYVFYQIPAYAHKFPLVMWHGIGQFSKTWETTPDGREGFQNSCSSEKNNQNK